MVNDLCAGKADIFAFEPIPDVFEALNYNAVKFNSAKIRTFPIALGKRSQITDFAYYPNATAISSLYPDFSGKEKQQFATTLKENAEKLPFPIDLIRFLPESILSFSVDRMVNFAYLTEKLECQVKTISQIINEYSVKQIDLLKIDVEKAELDVIEGINTQDWSKVRQVVIEVHNINDRVQKIANLLVEKGFSQVRQEQDPVFKHLDIYTIYAVRSID